VRKKHTIQMTSKLFTAYLFIISSFVVSQTTGEKDSTATVQTTSQTVEDTTQAVGDTTQVEPDQIDKISTMVLANRITNVSGFERMIIGDLLGDEMMETSAASMVISEGQAKEAMGANFDPNCFSDSCAISIGKSFNLSNVITFGIINVKKIADSTDADTLLAVKDSILTATIIMKNFHIGTGQVVSEMSFPFEGDTDKLLMTARRMVWSAVGVEPPPGRFPEDLIDNKVSIKKRILDFYYGTILPWVQDNREIAMVIGGIVLISGGWLIFGGGDDGGGFDGPPDFPDGPSSMVQL
tara:strand:- start:233 stop:1120 length:888 start_codon:yes stop_codon:yes gene_type:complete